MLKSYGAKLVYDVMKFDSKFHSVMLYCVGTAVVCETNEAAKLLAWNSDRRYQVTVPSNDSVIESYRYHNLLDLLVLLTLQIPLEIFWHLVCRLSVSVVFAG